MGKGAIKGVNRGTIIFSGDRRLFVVGSLQMEGMNDQPLKSTNNFNSYRRMAIRYQNYVSKYLTKNDRTEGYPSLVRCATDSSRLLFKAYLFFTCLGELSKISNIIPWSSQPLEPFTGLLLKPFHGAYQFLLFATVLSGYPQCTLLPRTKKSLNIEIYTKFTKTARWKTNYVYTERLQLYLQIK